MALRWMSVQRGMLLRLGTAARLQRYSKKVQHDSTDSISNNYSAPKTKYILEYMNNFYSGDKRLKDQEVSMKKVKQVIKDSGHLTTLDDLTNIVGLPQHDAVSLCDKIAAGMSKRKKKIQLCYPAISVSQAQKVQNVASIHNSLSCVSWAHLEISGRVLNWNLASFEMLENEKHSLDCISTALKFWEKLPRADLYIVESPDVRRAKHAAGALEAFLTTSLSNALLTIAGCRQMACGETPKLYSSNRILVPSLFDLSVGQETVARYTTVEKILAERKCPSSEKKVYTDILVDDWLHDRFCAGNVYEKEELAQPLLSAMAFMDIVIRQNPLSLEKLV